jgi:hypothetical protein
MVFVLYGMSQRGRAAMLKRLAILSGAIMLALALNGCTKCGWIWNDWQSPAKSCRDDIPK